MGADIHAFIEYWRTDRDTDKTDPYVRAFSEELAFPRSYTLFGIMAGVRRDDLELYEPRGVPSNLSTDADGHYYLTITDNKELKGHSGYCSLEDANKWVASGSSTRHTVANHEGLAIYEQISHPDWHSASWLTADELDNVQTAHARVEMYNYDTPAFQDALKAWVGTRGTEFPNVPLTPAGPHPYLAAVIAAMRALESTPGVKARLVFWFDN